MLALSDSQEALSDSPEGLSDSTIGQVLACLARAGDMGLEAGELDQAAGLHYKARQRAVARLMAAGLVVRQGERGRLYVTPAGMAEAGATSVPTASGPSTAALDQALSLLPAEGLRALTRLLLSVTVARYHLHSERPSGWLAAIACGSTRAGKTLAGHIACAIFGLDPALHVRLAHGQNDASLWGRRERVNGQWVLTPSPTFEYPFLVVDELDKADAETRTALTKLLQGEVRVAGEGNQVLIVRPAVLVTLNGDRSTVKPEYQRRSVVLDTDPLRPLLTDIDLVAEEVLAPGVLPSIGLAKLRPPAAALSKGTKTEMRSLLRYVLTSAGWDLSEPRGLELAALGRMALWGLSEGHAATLTALDYASCAVTTGEAHSDRLAQLRQACATDGVLSTEALGHAEAEQRALADNRRQTRLAADREALELGGARAAMATRLEDTARLLGRLRPGDPEHAIARGLSHQLSALRQDVQASRSRERLEELAPICEEHLRKAQALLAERAERERWAAMAQTPRRPALAPAPYLPPAGGPPMRRPDEVVPFTPNLMHGDGRLSRDALLPVVQVPEAKPRQRLRRTWPFGWKVETY